jgi:hypothetical protein
LPANDSASFSFRFIYVHSGAVSDRQWEQFFEVPYRGKLASGEIPVVLCLSPSQEQSGIILSYVKGILQDSRVLAQLIMRETAETIELSNRVMIIVRAASFRRLRGQTCVGVVFDEVAFFQSDESANPDVEILGAVKPSLATTGGPLIAISSPHRRKGVLWEAFKAHFGAKGDPRILVAKGTSRELNPCLTEEFVNRKLEKDPRSVRRNIWPSFAPILKPSSAMKRSTPAPTAASKSAPMSAAGPTRALSIRAVALTIVSRWQFPIRRARPPCST